MHGETLEKGHESLQCSRTTRDVYYRLGRPRGEHVAVKTI